MSDRLPSSGPCAPAGYYAQERPDVAAMVPAGAIDVLDCGCAEGVLGGRLRQRGCRVVGIEPHPTASEAAADRLDRVYRGTLEECLPALEPGSFDCAICADVLEHLVDPRRVLVDLFRVVREGGTLVCSVPNVRHLGVLVNLVVRGRWDYGPSGVLDHTHLRFFTKQSIVELLTECGFVIEVVAWNEERYTGALAWAARLAGWVSGEFRVAQWRIRARRP
jgi:O-antigen biosynthesis protein